MTPREHLALTLSYLDDLKNAVHGAALLLDDEDAYIAYIDERVCSEAMWLTGIGPGALDEEADEMLVEGYDAEIDEILTRLRTQLS